MQPDENEFKEWLVHPITEWVFGLMCQHGASQKDQWAEMAWGGKLDPLLLCEARVRADCYLALPETTYEDWKAIDDSANRKLQSGSVPDGVQRAGSAGRP